MQIIRHPEHCPESARGAVVALGNFDGVHLGHQAVIQETRKIAQSAKAPCGVMTFVPHPREFFNPNAGPLSIYPLAVKERLLKDAGMDTLYLLHFDATLAAMSADDFIAELLVRQLGVKHVVTGEDFAFGHKRSGNATLIEQRAGELGFGYSRVAGVSEAGEHCSSTRIRALLAQGNVATASRLLGRPYAITGRVVHGDERGRALGFPTANIALNTLYKPRSGVYAVRVTHPDGRTISGVANIGTRPTVDGKTPLLEVYCFDISEDLYELTLDVQPLAFLRDEQKFASLDALKHQIALDSAQAKTYLKS